MLSKVETAAEEADLRFRQDDLMKPFRISASRKKKHNSCSGIGRLRSFEKPPIDPPAIWRIAPNNAAPGLR